MSHEFFELTQINRGIALHGRAFIGEEDDGTPRECEVSQLLTDDQQRRLDALKIRQQEETLRLLSSFVDRAALAKGLN